MAVRRQQNQRGKQRQDPLPAIQSKVSAIQMSFARGARYRCHRASAVMSTRLPVRAISLVTLSLRLTLPARLCSSQLVYTLCKIDSRPRRRSTWCHLRLAASRVDRCQAYFPIGFTNSTPAHAVPCCMRTVQTLSLLPSTASIGLVSANRRHALYAKASPGRHDLQDQQALDFSAFLQTMHSPSRLITRLSIRAILRRREHP